jgi:hypothetical protein
MTVSDLLLINPQGEIVMGGKPDRQVYNEVRHVPFHTTSYCKQINTSPLA